PAPSFAAPPPGVPAKPQAEPLTPQPRDITELLRDFDLPVEEEPQPIAAKEPKRLAARAGKPDVKRLALVGAVVAVLGVGGDLRWRALQKPAAPALGTRAVQPTPPGAAVFVDGVAHGNTPARVSLTAGSHILELRGRGVPRVIPISVTAGAEASQYL